MMSMRQLNPTTQLDKMRNRVVEFGSVSLNRADVQRVAQGKKRTQVGAESAKDKSHGSKTLMLSWLKVSEETRAGSAKCRLDCNAAR